MSTSQQSVHLFDLRQNKGLYSLHQLDLTNSSEDDICGVKFSNSDPNLLYISTVMGKIYLHDTRTSDKVAETFEFDGMVFQQNIQPIG